MLKRLELLGFKSFADKTRFDFAPGVTAIVGPNGSGKSNIVDAVKWILGEQSSKSLRAGEMADVIFNGSSSRKSLGMAEVTMTFDNSRRQLGLDTDEVQLTRRVYRDGQGEYLINGGPSRLKDIKDLFLGSGAGQGAYSIIEQGRVDALLLASTKERRQIFEEAAGISRFRSKKNEALRKLERVDADLNRVRDLLQELEKNLRTLSTQAAKAQKYQEYHGRLKELRVTIGQYDYRELSETLEYQNRVLATLRDAVTESTQEAEARETFMKNVEAQLAKIEMVTGQHETLRNQARQQIADQEARARASLDQTGNLEAELLRQTQQRMTLEQRVDRLQTEHDRIDENHRSTSAAVTTASAMAEATAAALNVCVATLAELNRQSQADRQTLLELVNRSAQAHSAVQMQRQQWDRLQREQTRKQSESEAANREAETLGSALAELGRTDDDLQSRLTLARQSLVQGQTQQQALRDRADALQPELDGLRHECSEARGRVTVLERLEANREGIGAGVRAILERLPHPSVLGLVADFLTVSPDMAPLIDIALGEQSQQFVVRDEPSMRSLVQELGTLPGRVGLIPYQASDNPLSLQAIPGAVPAVRYIECPLPGLSEQLLGELYIVENAVLIPQLRTQYPELRLLTRAGELWEPAGTLTFGPARTETGLVSRKNELRMLRERIDRLDRQIQVQESVQAQARQQAVALETPIQSRLTEIATLSGEAGTLRERILEQRQRRIQLVEYSELLTRELTILTVEMHKARTAWTSAEGQAAAADTEALALQQRLAEAELQVRQAELTRETRQHEHTAAQVTLTEVRQQLATLDHRKQEIANDWKQRKNELLLAVNSVKSATERATQTQLTTLRASHLAAMAYGEKENQESTLREWDNQRAQLLHERQQLQEAIREHREAWKQRHDQAHAHELTVRDLQHRRTNIALRLQDDYQIDIAMLITPTVELGVQTLEPMQDEIEELKRKIIKLGSVNLEALDHLTTEETRAKAIRAEFDDLVAAEKSLLDIIEQINLDSRKLLNDTLTIVRGHFQELFRKLFGGGMADIVLEDPNDVLESGIEITARPPGKELRSISLLSGGEKTLTAVALLLAIFRSKPSPFCLLDEVDAALDEANTARLAELIDEFRTQSQFVIVTHKKRTMAMADVLYGVTMQESGVSIQATTRIEDWPDEQEHRNAA